MHPAGRGRGTRGTGTQICRAESGVLGGKGGEIEFWHQVLFFESIVYQHHV